MIHGEPGTATRSSGPAWPQTNRICPTGSQPAALRGCASRGSAATIGAAMNSSILMEDLIRASLYTGRGSRSQSCSWLPVASSAALRAGDQLPVPALRPVFHTVTENQTMRHNHAVIVTPITPVNKPGQVLFASLIGTTIEFFDFYIYATAAVIVFPRLFFPSSDPAAARLASLATFGLAFLARPVGSAIFGHFGDRVGRKTTLVAALLTMGVSTVVIGALPTYETIGLAAPLLLALCRFGQGLGLGGEWGGAVLLAIENAPPGRRAWYGMFPQLGAPIGFFFSGGVFLALSEWLTDEQIFAFGWRIPFLASAVLVLVGLYVRLTITETPVFREAVTRDERAKVPMLEVLRDYPATLVRGILGSLATFVLFYLMTV